VTIDINDREKLGKWFKDNLSPTALLDLKVDEKLIGGISFVWKGIKHEYSFKKMVQKKKDQILEIMDTIGNKLSPEALPTTQK
jgi:F0F1-type ATP synthase delta subunit